MRRWSHILSLWLLGLVAGCAAIPGGSLLELARIDIAQTDLTALRAAIQLPQALRPMPDAVVLDVTITGSDGTPATARLALREVTAASEIAGLERAGAFVAVYRLEDADRARFETLRRTPSRGIAIAVGVTAFCRIGDLPQGALPATSMVRTVETGARWVPLLADFNLRSDPRLAAAFDAVAPR